MMDVQSTNPSPITIFLKMLIQFILSLIQFNNSQRADCANNIRFTINLITKLQTIELQSFLNADSNQQLCNVPIAPIIFDL